MIERVPIRRDETSRYFHHNVGLAETWEKLAKQYNGSVTGLVNGQTLEFELKIQYQNINVKVVGVRQVSNVGGYRQKTSMTKNTVITFELIVPGKGSWKIYKKNSFIDFFNGILRKRKDFIYDDNYSCISDNKEFDIKKELPVDLFKFISGITELRSIERKYELFEIEYFNLIGVGSLEKLMDRVQSYKRSSIQ